MNLTTLAALAGVSVSTVSKAFSGSVDISAETREHVFRIARENGCFHKYDKHKFGKKVIAILCPEMVSEYYAAMVEEFIRQLRAHDTIVTVSATHFDKSIESELYTYYSSYCKADGIILISPQMKIENPNNVPTVALFASATESNVDVISADYKNSMEKALSHLRSLGHKKIGFAGERFTLSKMKHFKEAMQAEGLPINEKHVSVSNERFEKAGADIARQWHEAGEMPTAVVAAYDYIAIGLIRELRKKGYRIPEDVSVIGMDDISAASHLETSLSSIRLSREEICGHAIDLILKKINNQYYHSRQAITAATTFVQRESTATPPTDE